MLKQRQEPTMTPTATPKYDSPDHSIFHSHLISKISEYLKKQDQESSHASSENLLIIDSTLL